MSESRPFSLGQLVIAAIAEIRRQATNWSPAASFSILLWSQEIVPALTLSIGVASRDVTYPTSDHHDPVYGDNVIYPEATAGKTGGIGDDFRNVLQLQD